MSGQCYLYLIVPEGACRPVKIGIAANPQARLKQLQTGNPEPLRVAESYWALTREQAAYWEELAHQLFQKHRMTGEWFDCEVGTIMQKVSEWRRDGEPKTTPQRRVARSLPNAAPDWEPDHPFVPEHLRNRSPRNMTEQERLEYWGCFGLGAPPEGFDDWYLVGSPSSGLSGAFPVVGFMGGVHEDEQ